MTPGKMVIFVSKKAPYGGTLWGNKGQGLRKGDRQLPRGDTAHFAASLRADWVSLIPRDKVLFYSILNCGKDLQYRLCSTVLYLYTSD